MESSGSTPVPKFPLDDLVTLANRPGPLGTIVLTTAGAVENAAQQSMSHWRAASQQLAEAGAPPEVIDEVEALLPDAHLQGDTLAVIVDAVDGVVHVEHHDEPPKADTVTWSSVASLTPFIAWRQRTVPHLVVNIDRTGADLVAVGFGGRELERAVEGEADTPIRKPNAGGWSQRRFQERAENTWEQNADDVAKEVVRLVEEVGARLVVVAGDVRAVQLLRSALPAEVDELVKEIEGGRAAGVSPELMGEDLRRLTNTVVASDTVAVLEKFKEELGQADRAANGAAATIEALAKAQVDLLLVAEPDAEDDRTAWFGPDPTQVGLTEQAVTSLGVETAEQGPLVDVLVRSALGTGAQVRVLPAPAASGPSDGIGAILRWSD